MEEKSANGRAEGAQSNVGNIEPIEGELFDWFETGLEGVVWTLLDDIHEAHAGLHVIKEGDHLTIYGRDRSMLWQGTIRCDRETGRIPRPTNPDFKQQAALGQWVHWIQAGFEPDRWAAFFIRPDNDRLRGVLIKRDSKDGTATRKNP